MIQIQLSVNGVWTAKQVVSVKTLLDLAQAVNDLTYPGVTLHVRIVD